MKNTEFRCFTTIIICPGWLLHKKNTRQGEKRNICQI